MGAVVWRESLGQIPTSSHGTTFGGNPLACAASIATLTILRDQNIPQQVAATGEWLMGELEALNLSSVREIRGRGLMIGLELRGRVTPVLKALQDRGVLALPAGMNVLRLLPPLIIPRDDLRTGIEAIQQVLESSQDD
jgi:acetylornithine/LysW-gamma-L-lysine aminotransferase